jgi:hypothetical protein
MQHHVMAYRDVIAYDERMYIVSHMEHAKVLNIRPFSDPDVIHIAPNYSIEPHTAILTHNHIADHNGSFFDKARLWHGRLDALKGANHAGTLGEVNGFTQEFCHKV